MLTSFLFFIFFLYYLNDLKIQDKFYPWLMFLKRAFYYFTCIYLATKILTYYSIASIYLVMKGSDPSKFFLNFSVCLIEFPIFNCKFFNLILLLMTKSGPILALSSIISLFWKLIPSLYRSLLIELVSF